MDATEIEALFTRADGSFLCARWGRPLAPVIFGVDAPTLPVIKGAIEAVSVLARHSIVETDPELGANFMWFFCRDWGELLEVPNLGMLVPGLDKLVDRLQQAGANQYRIFRFDEAGAIKACFVFVRMDAVMRAVPAQTLALLQAVQSIVLWSDLAFRDRSVLARADDTVVLRPDISAVVRAVYDPVLPAVSSDASHALRIAARCPGLG